MDRIDRRFSDDGCVYDENGSRVSPLDDDYGLCRAGQEAIAILEKIPKEGCYIFMGNGERITFPLDYVFLLISTRYDMLVLLSSQTGNGEGVKVWRD